MSSGNPFRPGNLWRETSLVARIILFGLVVISGIVVKAFMDLVLQPGPLQKGEDLYVHIALLILVPLATIGMTLLIFGYAYYQICKREKIKPFWEQLS